MSVIEEINNQIQLGRSSFRETLENFDDSKWDSSPSSDEWTPRQIAEHAGAYDCGRSNSLRELGALTPAYPSRECTAVRLPKPRRAGRRSWRTPAAHVKSERS